MSRVLIFLTSSYPYGTGEPFVAAEIPYLDAAFDEIVVVSNDTEGELQHPLPASATCLRVPYELSPTEKLRSVARLRDPEPRDELRRIPVDYGLRMTRAARNSVLVSWAKANKFARVLRDLARERAGARIYAYSYWANDMALAAAVARARGWVDVAVCRAHGWDVYFERSATGFLPFRRYLAEHLDHYRFVSRSGLDYFRSRAGTDYRSLGLSPLGTLPLADEPVAQPSPFVLLSCSRLIPLKRVERIAQALERVQLRTTWIHIGDGPSRDSVERAAARLPEATDVELAGELPNAEVLETYRRRRPSLFVSLSETEGLPVTIMEAMSAGVPVVATAVGGVPEIVSDRSNGLMLGPDPDVADVGAAIQAFADMPAAEHRAYANAAWSTWNARFNASVNYPRFVAEVLA